MRITCFFIAACLLSAMQGQSAALFSTDTTARGIFPKSIPLVLQNLVKTEPGVAAQSIYLADSTLLVGDMYAAQTGFYFHEYALATKKLIRHYIPYGSQPGAAVSSFSSGYLDRSAWLYDIAAGKMVIQPLANGNVASDRVRFREYTGLPFFSSFKPIDSIHMFVSEMESTLARTGEYNLSVKKIEKTYGQFPPKPSDVPFDVWRQATRSRLFTNPAKDKIVLAGFYTHQFQIIDRSSGNTNPVAVDNSIPAFVSTKADGKDIMNVTADTRYGFLAGATTNRYIYLLGGGKKMLSGPTAFFGKTVFVYDWNGTPVATIDVDREINCFAVSADDSLFYSFDGNTGYVMVGPINGVR